MIRLSVRFAAPCSPVSVRIGRVVARGFPRVEEVPEAFMFVPGQVSTPVEHSSVRWLWLVLAFVLAASTARAQSTNPPSMVANTNLASRLIEAAGQVEFITPGQTNWQKASCGLTLTPGDRVRTREQSRAAVQLSDRSVIRLNERTTLEILPPRNAEKKRFGLPGGSIFFFNREKPADVEFDTPLAAGAIRGTEFFLEVAEADKAVHLALIDGLVGLQTQTGEVALQRGEDLRLAPGQPPQKTALVNAIAMIQWALYYPAILNTDELSFDASELGPLSSTLENYRAGDLLAALAAWPAGFRETSTGAVSLHAQLELAVGRVSESEQLVSRLPADAPAATALRELIAVVRGEAGVTNFTPHSSSEWLAHSYRLQSKADLPAARAAARKVASLAPKFGFAHARVAELEFSFGNRVAALEELKQTYLLSPRLASAYALQGFVLLAQDETKAALVQFERARELDAALGSAWLGRGLCLMRERNFLEARSAFQAAAALEPQRGLFRSYLGKVESELGEAKAAGKEFNLAKQLDPNDPTAWLYSALNLWQENRFNEAIRDLEKSSDLNDNRAAFRSRLLLDQDRAVRSANLAALYDDAGLPDVSRHAAAQAVSESYANFSGHLFLADSLAAQESVNRFDLRFETARQSELLVANLLAPPGAGNLSQTLSQQEHLRLFDERPIGVSTLSEYTSHGDWRQTGTTFGTLNGFSYALDASYEKLNGQQANGDAERRQFALTLKQRVTPDDEAYFQIGTYHADMGDVANYFYPTQSVRGFHAEENQEPTLYAGWHHQWSPGSHTLFLFSRLDDRFTSRDPNKNILFLQTDFSGSKILAVQQGPLPPFPDGQGPVNSDLSSDFTLYSAELQHIWETSRYSLILGGRWQSGSVDTHSKMTDVFPSEPQPNPVTDQTVDGSLERGDAYTYATWQVIDSLQLIGGASYTHISYPDNLDLPPLSTGETSNDLLSPKAGLLFQPWKGGLFRASYTKSLGGLYFDNSVRLEPTQVGGFNQAFRSLLPESVAGLVPGSEFETISAGFDQSLASGTFFGVETEQLSSHGERDVGAFEFFAPILTEATATTTRDKLNFREQNLSAYAGQLLGDYFSVASRYRISYAKLHEHFPDIPSSALGYDELARDESATLQQLSFTANFNHPSGLFAQWESSWYRQNNFGSNPDLPDENFWQHNISVGYRFPRRAAELRVGLLNLLDTDYRLNPLNLHADLPRDRTLAVSLRLNF